MRNQYTELSRGLHRSDCRFWPMITESRRRVHTAESGIVKALSNGYNSLTMTTANHGDQFPVPIPIHSALQIVLPDGEDYRSFWYTRYFPNSFCGICLTHQNAVTKAVIHPGYNLGYNSGEHRAPRYGSPSSLFLPHVRSTFSVYQPYPLPSGRSARRLFDSSQRSMESTCLSKSCLLLEIR